jgi:hypothetical protein
MALSKMGGRRNERTLIRGGLDYVKGVEDGIIEQKGVKSALIFLGRGFLEHKQFPAVPG